MNSSPTVSPLKDDLDSEKPKKVEDTVSYFALYRPDVVDVIAIVLGVIGGLVNAATMPVFSVVFGELIDRVQTATREELTDEIAEIALWFSFLGIATLVASFLQIGMLQLASTRQVARLRQRYLEACLSQEIAYYDTEATSGDVLSGLNEDCLAVQNAIGDKVGNAIHHAGTFIISIGVALWRGWELTLVMLALTPILGVAGGMLAKLTTYGLTVISKAYAKANTVSSQAVTNIRTVASFQSEEASFEKYRGMLDDPKKLQIRISSFSGALAGFVNSVMFLTFGVAFVYGSKLTRDDDKDYTSGRVLAVLFAVLIGGFSLGQAAPNFSYFFAGTVAGARIFKVINRKPLIDVSAPGKVLDKPLQGDIVLSGVSFAYPARMDVPVLRSLNFTVAAGQNVALVGASGSGKSTVIQLLQRFYDPAAGTITVDGHDIRSLSLSWYRGEVGLVSQEPMLFATSIRENIAMGRPGASEDDIVEAAKAANAHNFVSKLPEGYSTQVGEKGVQLSGGQKQRVAIARSLLKNPRVLLLDEATSALDTVSERLVQAALVKLSHGRTTIVIAHRLSTIRNCDKISVVRDGEIVEEGKHSELYERDGSVYHALVQLQQQAMDKRAEVEGDLQSVELEEEPDEDLQLIQAVEEVGNNERASKRALEETAKKLEEVQAAAKRKDDSKEKTPDDEELTIEEKSVKVGILRLLGMNKKEWPFLASGIFASACLGLNMPLFALFFAEILVALDPSKPRSEALKWAYAFFILGAIILVFAAIQGFSFAVVGANLAHRVRMLFYRAVLYMEVGWFDQDSNSAGALTARLSSDAPVVRGATGDILGMIIQNIVTLCASYIIAFINGWRMTLVITVVLPLLIFSAIVQTMFYTGGDSSGDALFVRANQMAHEGIVALRTVHSYNLQTRIASLYHKNLSEPNRKAIGGALKGGAALGVSLATMFFVYALGFWYGGQEMKRGRMDFEQMMKVFFAILLGSMGLSDAQMAFPDVAKGGKAVARIFRVVDRKSLIDASKTTGDKPPGNVAGEVELRDVTFCYPTRQDVMVFKNFNLTARPGEVTALVGESGSGKSTIVNLVERFYDVSAGCVLLDGHDVKSLNVSWLRSKVGLVSQEPVLFDGTILENVALGKPDASLADVTAACEVANALEFIEKQPDRFGTLLGQGGGISLSGGQKQRIAIARAVLKDPRVLLLDEATSALDADSERTVQDALDKLMVSRTSIVVAHRLTTIRHANKIAVVQSGVVLEEGTHDELMARGASSAYVQLARAQAGST